MNIKYELKYDVLYSIPLRISMLGIKTDIDEFFVLHSRREFTLNQDEFKKYFGYPHRFIVNRLSKDILEVITNDTIYHLKFIERED